jgi:hypothetical protein
VPLGHSDKTAQLLFPNAVVEQQLLLLPKLKPKALGLSPLISAVLAGRIVSLRKSAGFPVAGKLHAQSALKAASSRTAGAGPDHPSPKCVIGTLLISDSAI